jgi:hypothetical protein
MIIVSVTLHSAVSGERTELARMVIANDGKGADAVCHYDGETYRGRDGAALDRRVVQRRGRVAGYRRNDLHVWNLVTFMLRNMGYGT